MYRGLHDMYGTTFYFDEKTGIQAKDKFIRFADGRTRYFIPDTGNLVSTVLRKILRTRLGITSIATVMPHRPSNY